MSEPSPEPILDLIESFRRSKTLFTAVNLGVFDLLASNPASASELAPGLRVNTGALERLLAACTSLGLLQRSPDGRYTNAPVASRYLLSDSPDTLAGYILYSDRVLYRLWDHLDDAIRDGAHRWTQVFGVESALFSHFFRTPEAMREFILGMHGFGRICSPAVVTAFDLTPFRHLVDLGGATGHLAIAACERYPALRATVLDLPQVIEEARTHVAASHASARITLLPGDFFADPLPPADLYYTGRILHDWNEDKVRALLSRIYSALPAGGGYLIGEMLLDDDFTGPVPAHMQSLNMLVCTEGRERSPAEYRALLESAGFHHVEARRTGAPLDAVLALKPE